MTSRPARAGGEDPGRTFITPDNVHFVRRTTPYRQIHDADDYIFDDIRPGDRVIDIGANAGAFCIRASRYSPHVTAVEPVSADLLLENIRANGARVQVIAAGLGDGRMQVCSWDGCTVAIRTLTLGSLIRMAGGCDFLKCDCEGAEWSIHPPDLAPVRRIEMELHLPPISGKPEPALLEYIGRYYDFRIDRKPCHDTLGVMGILHAERCGGK